MSGQLEEARAQGPTVDSDVAIVRVETLSVDYLDRRKWVNVVNQVSFEIGRGESFGLAGESGCGKSTTAYALFGYARAGSRVREGRVLFGGQDLLSLREHQLRSIRGSEIGIVLQDPASSLTPSMRVGRQVIETLEAHGATSSRRDAERQTLVLFEEVGLPNPREMLRRYPHELSGGQQQRVVIALALSCRPRLLVLDEPTTALDVTTQARILRLLDRLKSGYGISMLYVTHDLGVIAQVCDRVAIMYAGELIEVAPTRALFSRPRHPYTRGLLAAVPRFDRDGDSTPGLRGLLRRDEMPDGCRFAPRCHHARIECSLNRQVLDPVGPDHQVACWRHESIGS
ncbi:MAG: ABC transporter ATP-binding protein [Nitriliruptorales bacterium]